MADATQSFIDNLITVIYNAEDSESVTNEMVARVFDYLNTGYKKLLTDNYGIDTEKSERQAADAALQRTINAVQFTLSEVRADINTILGRNASQAIENINEILAFLEGVKDSDSLVSFLEEIRGGLDRLTPRVAANEQGISEASEKFDELRNSVGKAGGLAPLGDNGKVPDRFLPDFVTSAQLRDAMEESKKEIGALRDIITPIADFVRILTDIDIDTISNEGIFRIFSEEGESQILLVKTGKAPSRPGMQSDRMAVTQYRFSAAGMEWRSGVFSAMNPSSAISWSQWVLSAAGGDDCCGCTAISGEEIDAIIGAAEEDPRPTDAQRIDESEIDALIARLMS